jgi:predicted HTH domain antitoxin
MNFIAFFQHNTNTPMSKIRDISTSNKQQLLMKTLNTVNLENNPGEFLKSVMDEEVILLTNEGSPLSLCIPVECELMEKGIHVNMAVKLFEDGLLSLVRSAKLAKMSVESFMELLATLDIPAVSYDAFELEEELNLLEG